MAEVQLLKAGYATRGLNVLRRIYKAITIEPDVFLKSKDWPFLWSK